MSIGSASLIEVSMRMVTGPSKILNVWQYEVVNGSAGSTAVDIAEAWWNHVKATYRALAISGAGRQFDAVVVRELNNSTGDLAEFSIPSSEQDGTRSAGTLGSYMPDFAAVGVRLTVGSRVTRSGQKRIPFLTEGDVAGNAVGATFVGLVEDLFDVMDQYITLGAPAALTELQPIVTRKDSTGDVTAHQNVLGYVVNPYVTTQNTRKAGRGM